MGMICERKIDYYDTKFVETDDGMYVRMIKKHFWSKWKLVVYKGSNKPILFFKKEVDNYWRGSGVEMCPIDTDGNLDKWVKYDLM